MSKIGVLTDVTVIPSAAIAINSNYDTIVAAFDNTLSRDGSAPNQMEADIDLNNNDLLNVNVVNCEVLKVNGTDVTSDVTNVASIAATAVVAAGSAAASAGEAAASASLVAGIQDNLPEWRGGWIVSTPYSLGDLVHSNGSTYICTFSHISTNFSNELGLGYWELFASQGLPGAGTGNVVAANAGLEYISVAGTFRNSVSAMLRAILKRSGLNLATDLTLDTSIYNSDGTNTNGPPGNVDGDSFVSSKIDTSNYNYLWWGNSKAWLGRRIANVNTWVKLFTAADASGAGGFVATLVTKPVVGDNLKLARFDGAGNISPGPLILNQEDMLSDSTVNVPTQHSVKFFVERKAGTNRSWKNMLGSRLANTSYQNTTGGPIQVVITGSTSVDREIQASTDNINWVRVGILRANHASQGQSFTVENGHYYRIFGTITAIGTWSELR